MIPEIGIVIGLYILTRLTPTTRPKMVVLLSGLTMLVTLVAITDLVTRGLSSTSLFTLVASTFERDEPKNEGVVAVSKSGTTTITRADGGSITTPLAYGIAIAKDSSLKREWIAAHDSTMPADLDGTPGVTTVYVSKEYGGNYFYSAKIPLEIKQAVRAVEIRFLVFDVWGNHVRTLSSDSVADIAPGKTTLNSKWSIYSENEVEAHYASIGYVARVRLVDGRIVEIPQDAIIAEARRFAKKFTPEQLEPKPQPRPIGTP